MTKFHEWLTQHNLIEQLRLIETYFSFDPNQYNQLFRDELEKVLQRTNNPEQRRTLESMRDFNWIAYISTCIRTSTHDQREVQERTHDLVTKLLMGKLFRGYDENSGPMDRRLKISIKHALINYQQKERNRRKFIPSISQDHQAELPARPIWNKDLIHDFRKLVWNHLGEIGLGVFNARVAGQEMKTLVGNPDFGRPSTSVLKRVIREIKGLAKIYAGDDTGFLQQVERAMGRESATVAKRLATARERESKFQ